MIEIHPSISAVGSHLDERVKMAALTGIEKLTNRFKDFSNEFPFPVESARPEPALTEEEKRIEEAMHLDQ